MVAIDDLLSQAVSSEPSARKEAFLKLLASDDWNKALSESILEKQIVEVDQKLQPDFPTFQEAAQIIAQDEEKIHRALQILNSFSTENLLMALAQHMGKDLVEHALDHLRTADGERALLLERVLYESDPLWVCESSAKRLIRNRLKNQEQGRSQLIEWLSDAEILADYIQELREFPPRFVNEWRALAQTGIREEIFINRATALLGPTPDPLVYLLSLDPVPEGVWYRLLAAARPEWLMTGLELILSEGFSHRLLLPVIELAIRMGGKHQSLALTWINTSHLGPEILNQLSAILVGKEGKRRLNELLWIQRRLPSSKRALEDGRKGKIPNPSDAAALIRQLQGDQAVELTREILETPQAHLFEIILHPLCNLSLEAAATVVDLTQSSNPEVASRAKSVLSWPDVIWPEPEKPPELPNTFTPLGKGI